MNREIQKRDTEIISLKAEIAKNESSSSSGSFQRQTSDVGQVQKLLGQTRQQQVLIDSLKKEQASFNQLRMELEDKVDNLSNEKMSMNRELMRYKADLEMATVKMDTLEREMQQRQQQLEQERRRQQQYESSKSVFDAKMAQVSETETRLKTDLWNAEQELAEQARKYETEIANLKAEVISAQRAEANAESERSALEEQRQSLQSDIRRLQALISSMKNELLEFAHVKGELEFKLQSVTTEKAGIKSELVSSREELELCRSKIDTLGMVI